MHLVKSRHEWGNQHHIKEKLLDFDLQSWSSTDKQIDPKTTAPRMDEKVILHALQVYFWDHCLVQSYLKTHQSFLLLLIWEINETYWVLVSGGMWDVLNQWKNPWNRKTSNLSSGARFCSISYFRYNKIQNTSSIWVHAPVRPWDSTIAKESAEKVSPAHISWGLRVIAWCNECSWRTPGVDWKPWEETQRYPPGN